jgi:hypothetical protein
MAPKEPPKDERPREALRLEAKDASASYDDPGAHEDAGDDGVIADQDVERDGAWATPFIR